jgi:hypothetical protein
MTLAAVSLVITWIAHLALAMLPYGDVVNLLLGKASAWESVLVSAALVPQLYLIPWALRDSGARVHHHTARLWWRISFLVLGFLAVSLYLCHSRFCPAAGRGEA